MVEAACFDRPALVDLTGVAAETGSSASAKPRISDFQTFFSRPSLSRTTQSSSLLCHRIDLVEQEIFERQNAREHSAETRRLLALMFVCLRLRRSSLCLIVLDFSHCRVRPSDFRLRCNLAFSPRFDRSQRRRRSWIRKHLPPKDWRRVGLGFPCRRLWIVACHELGRG